MRTQGAHGGALFSPPSRLDTSTKIAVNAASPTTEADQERQAGRLRPRRVQHQHGRDDRQRGEGNHKGKGDELGQFRGPICRHSRNVANPPGSRGTSAAGRARSRAGNHVRFPLCESFRVATLALVSTGLRLQVIKERA